jgi:hypothetical protein
MSAGTRFFDSFFPRVLPEVLLNPIWMVGGVRFGKI